MDAELFTPGSDGWLIADYAATQTSRSELETLETSEPRREKKARRGRRWCHRGVSRGRSRGSVQGKCPPDSTGRQAGRVAFKEEPRDDDSVVSENDSLSELLSESFNHVDAEYAADLRDWHAPGTFGPVGRPQCADGYDR